MPENKNPLLEASNLIKNEGIIVAPTETLYGFSCDATDNDAIQKINKIKSRENKEGFVILVKDINMAKKVANIDNKQEKFLKKVWPGPVTCILPAKSDYIADEALNDDGDVALRVSPHPCNKALFQYLNIPIVSTSANISGEEPIDKPEQLREQLEGEKDVDMVIDWGEIENKQPSTIIDLTTIPPECKREGQIPCESLIQKYEKGV